MNERIQELLIEAHKQTNGGIYSGDLSEWTEKFAKMIARECAMMVQDEQQRYPNMSHQDLVVAGVVLDNLAARIQDHFGIE